MKRERKNRFVEAIVKIECELQALCDESISMPGNGSEAIAVGAMFIGVRNHAWLVSNRLRDWPESDEGR